MSPAGIAESFHAQIFIILTNQVKHVRPKKTDCLIGENDFTIGVGLGNKVGGCVEYLSIFLPAVSDFMIAGDNNIQVCPVCGRENY